MKQLAYMHQHSQDCDKLQLVESIMKSKTKLLPANEWGSQSSIYTRIPHVDTFFGTTIRSYGTNSFNNFSQKKNKKIFIKRQYRIAIACKGFRGLITTELQT